MSTAFKISLILELKQDNPARSINTIINIIKKEGLISKGRLPRASVHRFLQKQKLSKRILQDQNTIERRSFVAKHAGDLWQGDVLHGPSIQNSTGMRKTYLVSLLDDASLYLTVGPLPTLVRRFFCTNEFNFLIAVFLETPK